MPDPDAAGHDGGDGHAFPSSANESDFIKAALPLLIKLASESAAATTRSAAAQSAVEARVSELKVGLEGRISELKTAVEKCSDVTGRAAVALDRQSVALEADHKLATEEIKLRQDDRTQFHATLRSIFTPQVITPLLLQILAMVSVALGFYSQMPHPTAAQQAHEARVESRSSGSGGSAGALSTDGNDP